MIYTCSYSSQDIHSLLFHEGDRMTCCNKILRLKYHFQAVTLFSVTCERSGAPALECSWHNIQELADPCGTCSVGWLPPQHWAALQRKHFFFIVTRAAYHHRCLIGTFSTCLTHFVVGGYQLMLFWLIPTPNALHMPQVAAVWVRTSLSPSPSTLTPSLVSSRGLCRTLVSPRTDSTLGITES